MNRTLLSFTSSLGMLAILTACSTAPQASLPQASTAALVPSRVAGDTKFTRDDLLYVSDAATNDVYVYRWPTGVLKQTLTGFNSLNGLCADRAGDIWIANTGSSELQEYAHGGTQPIATLADSGEYPFSCSVDPTTGDLAVTNLDVSDNNGNVGIYANATGSPKFYTDHAFYHYFSCAYDDKGNLFVNGAAQNNHAEFGELPHGSGTFTTLKLLKLPAKILIPGGIQWDGRYVAIGSQLSPVAIYQVQVSGSTGTVVGATLLDDVQVVIGFWKQGGKVVAPDALAGEINFYDYPTGGDPIKVISHSGEPVGAVVSQGAK
jgi:hypothetical protein